jgi:enoyl-CoA hydratase/carnithine racemase
VTEEANGLKLPLPFERYEHIFPNVALERRDGIIQIRLHTNGGPLRWSGSVVDQLQQVFQVVGADRGNKVVILTGTDDQFSGPVAGPEHFPHGTPASWEASHWRVRRLITHLIELECPVISAVNGPAVRHCELPLLGDVVVAAETAYFQDSSHFRNGLVPGDGVHVVLPYLMGFTRARHFMLTGKELPAAEALQWGVVNEVLPADQVLPRAWEIAEGMAALPPLVLRYTRVALMHALRQAVVANQGYGVMLEAMSAIGREE